MKKKHVIYLALILMLFVPACGKKKSASHKKDLSSAEMNQLKVNARSWKQIKSSGVLRVLKLAFSKAGISASISKNDLEESFLKAFSSKYQLRLKYIYFECPEKLIVAMKNGEGDLVTNEISRKSCLAADLAITNSIPSNWNRQIDSNITWGLRKNTGMLKPLNNSLHHFIQNYNPNHFTGDLPAIKKRRYIRVLTRNNPACYFIHRGASMGFEYELSAKFAKKYGLQVIVVVPPKWDDMIPWLIAGKGDLIAAAMTLTKKRKYTKGVAFCQTYCPVKSMVVTRKNDKSIRSPADLAGRTFVVRKHSSYWGILSKLKARGIALKLVAAPQTMETDKIIESVQKGIYDLTLADNLFLKTSIISHKISTPLTIGEPQRYAWCVRANNPLLKKAVDAFITKKYRGIFYNILHRKYFRSTSSAKRYKSSSVAKSAFNISPYDHIVKKYASMYNLPWCLISAQMYQESRFNPKAKSWAGTIGLMQLMPSTAKEMHCRNIRNPSENIKAGVKYMSLLLSRIPKSVKGRTRFCFALAGYNGGYGHLLDARKLAGKMNLNQNKWFGHVEKAMKLLSRKKYYSKARYGYCRSSEITNYVQNIIVKFLEYEQAMQK